MAFGSKTGNGFSFGTSGSSSLFGATASTTKPGLTLGQTNTATTQPAATGLNFGAKPSFGLAGTASSQTVTTQSNPGTGLSFGASAGSLFSKPAATNNAPFSLSATATTAAATSAGAFPFGKTTGSGLLFGNTSTPTTSAFSLGNKPASTGLSFGTPAQAPSGGLILGGTPATTTASGLSFGTPVTTTASMAAPALSFGSPSTGATTGSLSFGTKPATASGLNIGTTQPATGLPVGAVSTTPSSGITLGATAKTTAPSAFSIGGLTSASAAAATTTTGSSIFGNLVKPAASTAVATTTAGTGFNIPVSSTPATTTAAAASGTAAKPAAVLTYRQLEDMINKWNQELDEQERHFLKETSKLNQWDRTLVSNADRISTLHSSIQTCESEQKRIEQDLEFIEGQQRELEVLLEPLENAAKEFPPTQQHVDAEREAIYQMAIGADYELGQLLIDLKQLATRVNSTTGNTALSGKEDTDAEKNVNPSPPDLMTQVTKILNAHMHSLNWIHSNTQQLMDKLKLNAEATKDALPSVCVKRLHCKQFAVRAVRFNADGQYCVTGGGDKQVKLWNPFTGLLLKSYVGHGAEVSDVQASADNSQLASGGNDCVVMLWDVATGNSLRRWRKHPGRVNAVLFAGPTLESSEPGKPGGASLLLSVGVDGMLLAWDARSRSPYPVQKMHEAKDSVTCIAANGHQIITGSVDRFVRTYDLRRGQMTEDFVGYPVTSISVSFDEQCLLVGCQDSTLRLFDSSNGELLAKYRGHKNEAYHIDSALFGRDAYVLSGSEESQSKEVLVWDMIRGTEPILRLNHAIGSSCWAPQLSEAPLPPAAVYAANTHFIHSISPHPEKPFLLTAGGDYVWLWSSPQTDETDEGEEDASQRFIGPLKR